MLVRFWGTRGSLPVSMTASQVRAKVVGAVSAANGRRFGSHSDVEKFVDDELDFSISGTYGGCTSCIEIDKGDDEFLICDMGSGLRNFGLDSLRRKKSEKPSIYHIFMSHLHWDHIMGFPFFVPAFVPGNRINFYGGHATIEEALFRQQEKISFPVPLEFMNADISYRTLETGRRYELAGCAVELIKQRHDNDSYGFKFIKDNRKIIYTTDSEHKIEDEESNSEFAEFFSEADLVIFDTMYSLADSITLKEDWGHSSGVMAVDLCHRAAVGKLAMFHHEPAYDDAMVQDQFKEVLQYEELTRGANKKLTVLCAYDGLEINV